MAILEVDGILRAIEQQEHLYFSEGIPYPVRRRYKVEVVK
jgi:hypothetical protein